MVTNDGNSFSHVALLLRLVGDGDDDEPSESASESLEDDIQVESTGIVMESLWESLEDGEEDNDESTPRDIFETPPEIADARFDGAPDCHDSDDEICTGEVTTVDLGRDTDIAFCSEVEFTRRIEIETEEIEIQSQLEKVRVSKRALFSPNEGKSKRPKLSCPKVCLGTETEIICRERSVNSMEKLNFKGTSLYQSPTSMEKSVTEERISRGNEDCEASSVAKRKLDFTNEVLDIESYNEDDDEEGKHEKEGNIETGSIYDRSPHNHQVSENCETSNITMKTSSNFTMRKLDFSTGVSASEVEDNNDEGVDDAFGSEEENEICLDKYIVRNIATRTIDDINKFRYVGPSVKNFSSRKKLEIETQETHVLPVSILEQVEDGGEKVEAERDCRNKLEIETRETHVLPVSILEQVEGRGEKVEAERDCNSMELTLLEVLKMLSKDKDVHYEWLSGLNILDVAKRQGVTFPRPGWWPEDFHVVDD